MIRALLGRAAPPRRDRGVVIRPVTPARYFPRRYGRPPTGPDWVDEIRHDGYRLMARRDPVSPASSC